MEEYNKMMEEETRGFNEMEIKTYYEQNNIGKCKYLVNYHDGEKKHADGSDFYDVKLFSNKVKKRKFIKELLLNGYREREVI